MKQVIAMLVAIGIVVCFSVPVYASDWDKAGIALAVTEGVRVITSGKVDIIGNITGINRNRESYGHRKDGGRYAKSYPCPAPSRVWVPHYVWNRKYIPEHQEYSKECGTIIVEGHYIRYQVEKGGHWE
jgi:hypothetical protein